MLVSAGYVQEGNPLGLNLRIKYKNQLKICFRQMMLNFIFLHYMTTQCMKVVLHHQFHLLKLNLKQGTVSLDLKLKNCEGHPFGPHVEQPRKFRPTRKFQLMLRCEEMSELKFYLSFLSRSMAEERICMQIFYVLLFFGPLNVVFWRKSISHADPVNVQATAFSFIMVRGQLMIRKCTKSVYV